MLDDAGDAAPLRGDGRSPLPLRERVEAAAAAGFRGMGMLHVDLIAAERTYGIGGIRALLIDHGLVQLKLELLTDWWADGPLRRESDRLRREAAVRGRGARRPAHQGRARRRRCALEP